MSPLRKAKSTLFTASLYLCAILALAPLMFILFHLLDLGMEALTPSFFLNESRPVGEPGGGMLHAILGTLLIVGTGAVLAIPLGILCGVFISEFPGGHVHKILGITIDLLAGIPSIVIGILAYLLLVVSMKTFSGLAGSLALAIIMTPIVARSTEEVLKLVPTSIREGGLALGLPRWRVIFSIIIKTHISSIITGIMLSISRASGETAPLLFTALGASTVNWNMLHPMSSLPTQIYDYAISPFADWQAQAWTGALVLLCLVFAFNLLARLWAPKHS